MESDGNVRYSSFIPPLPKTISTNMYAAPVPEMVSESPEEIRARVALKLKNTKLYAEPEFTIPRGIFPAKFLGLSVDSFVLLKFMDAPSQAQYKLMCENANMCLSKQNKPGSNSTKMPPEEIDVNRLVFAKDKDGNYFRGRIINKRKDGTLQVKNCDEWIYMEMTCDDIYYMIPSFLENSPFMAHGCKLKGLEIWYGTKALPQIFYLIDKFYEDVRITECTRDMDGVLIVTVEVKLKEKKKVGVSEDGPITLNALFSRIIQGFTRVPRHFFKGNCLENAHIAIIEENGEVWIQLHSEITEKLTNLGANPQRRMSSDKYNRHVPAISDFEYSYFVLGDRRFLAKYLSDPKLYRVEVIGKVERGDNEVYVQYLDFGNKEVISVDDIIPTALVDPTLNATPKQCFKGYLRGLDVILDSDRFFDIVGMINPQKFRVAGIKDPGNFPIMDVFAKLNTSPDEWTYVNKYIVDNGIGTGAIPLQDQSFVTNLTSPIALGQRSVSEEEKQRQQRFADNKRFLASCRVEESVDGDIIASIQSLHLPK